MKSLSKDQATMLVFDVRRLKTRCKKTSETFSSLRERGYLTASEMAGTQVPSSYLFSQKEGRLFSCSLGGCTEVVSAKVKLKGWEVF